MYKLSLVLFLATVGQTAFAEVGNLSASTKTVVSTDSPHTPTASKGEPTVECK